MAAVAAATSVMSTTADSTSTPRPRSSSARVSSDGLVDADQPDVVPSRAKRRATEPLTPGPAPTTRIALSLIPPKVSERG